MVIGGSHTNPCNVLSIVIKGRVTVKFHLKAYRWL